MFDIKKLLTILKKEKPTKTIEEDNTLQNQLLTELNIEFLRVGASSPCMKIELYNLMQMLENENFGVMRKNTNNLAQYNIWYQNIVVASFTFLKEKEKIRKFKVAYFDNIVDIPYIKDFAGEMGSQTYAEFYFLKPDIMIKKVYKPKTKLLCEESIPLELCNITRFKGEKRITEEEYTNGSLSCRRIYEKDGILSEYYDLEQVYNTGAYTRNQFKKRYQNALSLTKEKKQ